MVTKIFLDTNIILDVFDDKRIFHQDSVSVYKLVEDGTLSAFLSETVLTVTDYILQKVMTSKNRKMLFKELNGLIKILPCTNKSFEKALHYNFKDLEDALLYEIALENNLDYFVTNDMDAKKKLQSSIMQVISPKGLLKILA